MIRIFFTKNKTGKLPRALNQQNLHLIFERTVRFPVLFDNSTFHYLITLFFLFWPFFLHHRRPSSLLPYFHMIQICQPLNSKLLPTAYLSYSPAFFLLSPVSRVLPLYKGKLIIYYKNYIFNHFLHFFTFFTFYFLFLF